MADSPYGADAAIAMMHAPRLTFLPIGRTTSLSVRAPRATLTRGQTPRSSQHPKEDRRSYTD
jgi:hypothetical protein